MYKYAITITTLPTYDSTGYDQSIFTTKTLGQISTFRSDIEKYWKYLLSMIFSNIR